MLKYFERRYCNLLWAMRAHRKGSDTIRSIFAGMGRVRV